MNPKFGIFIVSRYIIFIIAVLLVPFAGLSQQKSLVDHFPEITISESNCPADGYFFISSNQLILPQDTNYIAIISNKGVPVFFRLMPYPVNNFGPQPNGYVTYNPANSDSIFVIDSAYSIIDTITDFEYSFNDADYIIDQNNHLYILGYDFRNFDMSSIIEGGNPNAIIKEPVIQILDQNQIPTFTWKSSDHFSIADANQNSPYLNLKASEIDYISITDIEIDSDTTILIVCSLLDEITKVNIKTGDIIWRFGGKNNDFTFLNDDKGFSHPLSVNKLTDGNLVIFDSGVLHDKKISSAVEYSINELSKTVTLIRRDGERKGISGYEFAGLQHLNNGNNMIYWGSGNPSITEYHPNGTVALNLDFSNHSISKKITKTDWKTNVFYPVIDSINFGMWDYTIYRYILIVKNTTDNPITITNLENNTEHFYTEQTVPFEIPSNGTKSVIISYFPENLQTSVVQDILTIISESEVERIAQQVKLVGYRDDFTAPTIEIYPEPNSTNIKTDTILYFNFSEPLRFADGTELDYENISGLIMLKLHDQNGSDIAFNASVSSEKDKITIVPSEELIPGETYYLRFEGSLEDYYNNALASQMESFFTTEELTSIQYNYNPDISIFPNPASDKIMIISDKTRISDIIIYNTMGSVTSVIKNINEFSFVLNICDFNYGIYYIRLNLNNNQNFSTKIIVLQ